MPSTISCKRIKSNDGNFKISKNNDELIIEGKEKLEEYVTAFKEVISK